MLNGWLQGVDKKIMYQTLIGDSAFCWAIWLSSDDMIFNNILVSSSLQVLFRGTRWIRFCALLQKGGGEATHQLGVYQ